MIQYQLKKHLDIEVPKERILFWWTRVGNIIGLSPLVDGLVNYLTK